MSLVNQSPLAVANLKQFKVVVILIVRMTTPIDLPNPYHGGKIYSVYVPGMEEICYIGATIQELDERLRQHRNDSNKSDDVRKCLSYKLFEEGNEPVIKLIELFKCETRKALDEREAYWIKKFPECINKNIPLQSHKEWVATHQDHIKAYNEKVKPIRLAKAKVLYDAGYKDVRNAKKREKALCPTCGKEMNKNSIPLHLKSVHK